MNNSFWKVLVAIWLFSILSILSWWYILALPITSDHTFRLNSDSGNSGNNNINNKLDKNNQDTKSLDLIDEDFVEFLPNIEWLFPLPPDIASYNVWRYKSTNLYWTKNDYIYRKFQKYKDELENGIPQSILDEVNRVCTILTNKGRDKLCRMFKNCYLNTIETTVTYLNDSTTYIITGDIDKMWMRDSSAQVHHYLPLMKNDPLIQVIVEGVIRRQIQWIKLDPYGASFRLQLTKPLLTNWDIESGRTIHVAMHNYEVDSLCYFFRLSFNYWKEMDECRIFEEEWLATAKTIINLWYLEQNHDENSDYVYPILDRDGKGKTSCFTGMTWGAFRPSDDPCTYHYSIPSNMFVVVVLRYLRTIIEECYPLETEFYQSVVNLEIQIEEGIANFGVVTHNGKKMYAYEVDGCGNHILMDDANIPSLLSMDYLGFATRFDPGGSIKANTYSFILSPGNPFFYSGRFLSGIGSPHTYPNYVWPMSVIVQGLSTRDPIEVNRCISMLETSDSGTEFMHESVFVENPGQYTRAWFAWANSLFSELIFTQLEHITSNSSPVEIF